MRIDGEGALTLLGPASTQCKVAAWHQLLSANEEERLVMDQRAHVWVRFERDGFRIYLVQELLPVLRFQVRDDLDERVYVQAAPGGDVFIFSVDAFLRRIERA